MIDIFSRIRDSIYAIDNFEQFSGHLLYSSDWSSVTEEAVGEAKNSGQVKFELKYVPSKSRPEFRILPKWLRFAISSSLSRGRLGWPDRTCLPLKRIKSVESEFYHIIWAFLEAQIRELKWAAGVFLEAVSGDFGPFTLSVILRRTLCCCGSKSCRDEDSGEFIMNLMDISVTHAAILDLHSPLDHAELALAWEKTLKKNPFLHAKWIAGFIKERVQHSAVLRYKFV